MPTSLSSSKYTIPQATHGGEGIVAAFVAFMVPVMVMRHLGKRKPILQGVSKVKPAANS